MIQTRFFRRIIVGLSCWVGSTSFAAELCVGNGDIALGDTLSHPAGSCVASSDGSLFFVGAVRSGAGRYTLATGFYGQANNFVCRGIMPDTVTLDDEKKQKNPLYDTKIALLSVEEEKGLLGKIVRYKPLVVTEQEPNVLYSVERYTVLPILDEQKTAKQDDVSQDDMATLCSLRTLYDAHGNKASRIVGIQPLKYDSLICVAVAPKDGNWGDPGSGIALIRQETEQKEEKKIIKDEATGAQKEETLKWSVPVMRQIDVLPVWPAENAPIKALPVATALTARGSEDASVVMHWDESLQRLYIAPSVIKDAEQSHALAVAYLDKLVHEYTVINPAKKQDSPQRTVRHKRSSQKDSNKEKDNGKEMRVKRKQVIRLASFIDPTILSDCDNAIVAGDTRHGELHIHGLKTMVTTTGLRYLIVQGGTSSQHTKSVYALPLVSNHAELDALSKKIRELTKSIENIKTSDSDRVEKQKERHALEQEKQQYEALIGCIADKQEAPSAADRFAQKAPHRLVKRGFSKTPNDVYGLTHVHDAAACVGGDFLHEGAITDMVVKGDTVFAAVAETDDPLACPGIFSSQALFDATGKIKGWTRWQRALSTATDAGELDAVQKFYLDDFGRAYCFIGESNTGITAIKRSSWLANQDDETMSLVDKMNKLIGHEPGGIQAVHDIPAESMGNDSSLLALVGSRKLALIQTDCMRNGKRIPRVGRSAYRDDALEGDRPISHIVFDFPELHACGPLTSVAYSYNNDRTTIFVGGVNGVGALTAHCGFEHDSDLSLKYTFKQLGTWRFVKKLYCNDNFLYVLTDTQLIRMRLDHAEMETTATVMADAADLFAADERGVLTDVVISGKFALLATSNGLLRVANDNDIRAEKKCAWTGVELPGGLPTVTHLAAVSVTGRASDVAALGGGMVYAITTWRGKNKAHIVRFSVQDVTCAPISDAVIKPLPDFFVKGVQAPFVDLFGTKNQFVTDGALFFVAQDRDGDRAPSVELLNAVKPGNYAAGKKRRSVPLALNTVSAVTGIVRCSATGNWIITSDNGVWAHE